MKDAGRECSTENPGDGSSLKQQEILGAGSFASTVRYGVAKLMRMARALAARFLPPPRCVTSMQTNASAASTDGEDGASKIEARGIEDAVAPATIDIYNFDHCITSPWSFNFGPYRIHVRPEHLDPAILAYSGGHNFSSRIEGEALIHTVTPIAARPGTWQPTAVIESAAELGRSSRVLPNIPHRTEREDLELVLSFLTGRAVTIGNGAAQQAWLRSGEPIVVGTFFYRPNLDWSALPTLEASGAADAMHVVCLAMTSPDLMTKFALGSAALDRLSGGWFGTDGSSLYSDDVRAKVKSAKPAIEAALRSTGLSESQIADIAPRIGNLCNDSAIAKLRAFLQAHGMFPQKEDTSAEKRLSQLNKHRNAVLHRATIHVISEASFETNAQIAGAVAHIIIMICRVYVSAHLLKIENDTYGIEKDRETILTFFAKGHFRNQDVYGESFGQFLSRVHESWTDRGEFPA